MLSEAAQFFRQYSDEEYAVRVAQIAEPDDQRFNELRDRLDVRFDEGFNSGISRAPGKPASDYQDPDLPQQLAMMTPRPVFLVKRHRHSELGDLYSAYLGIGLKLPRGEAFSRNLFARRSDGGLKIVARYNACTDCGANGCRKCAGGWLYSGGARLKGLSPPLEIEKLQPPVRDSVAAYEAMRVE